MQSFTFTEDGGGKYLSPVINGDGSGVAIIHLEFEKPTRVDIYRCVDPKKLQWALVSSGVRPAAYEESIVGLVDGLYLRVVAFDNPKSAILVGGEAKEPRFVVGLHTGDEGFHDYIRYSLYDKVIDGVTYYAYVDRLSFNKENVVYANQLIAEDFGDDLMMYGIYDNEVLELLRGELIREGIEDETWWLIYSEDIVGFNFGEVGVFTPYVGIDEYEGKQLHLYLELDNNSPIHVADKITTYDSFSKGYRNGYEFDLDEETAAGYVIILTKQYMDEV